MGRRALPAVNSTAATPCQLLKTTLSVERAPCLLDRGASAERQASSVALHVQTLLSTAYTFYKGLSRWHFPGFRLAAKRSGNLYN